jgi:hypothetical protein
MTFYSVPCFISTDILAAWSTLHRRQQIIHSSVSKIIADFAAGIADDREVIRPCADSSGFPVTYVIKENLALQLGPPSALISTAGRTLFKTALMLCHFCDPRTVPKVGPGMRGNHPCPMKCPHPKCSR